MQRTASAQVASRESVTTGRRTNSRISKGLASCSVQQRPLDRFQILDQHRDLSAGDRLRDLRLRDVVPEALAHLPATARGVLGSGIATGGLCAIGLNLLLPRRAARR